MAMSLQENNDSSFKLHSCQEAIKKIEICSEIGLNVVLEDQEEIYWATILHLYNTNY